MEEENKKKANMKFQVKMKVCGKVLYHCKKKYHYNKCKQLHEGGFLMKKHRSYTDLCVNKLIGMFVQLLYHIK